MDTAPDLDVGVIYTHERQWMSRLLATLAASADGLAMRLILVDNASAEGVEPWRRVVGRTEVLRNPRRLSYAANLNRILQVSTARYVLLLNSDMYFDPPSQCPARMVRFMEAHPDCGIAGCRLYHEDGGDAFPARRFQTLPIILARRCGLGRLLPGVVDRYLYRDRDPRESFDCDWLSGCFLMLRARGPLPDRRVRRPLRQILRGRGPLSPHAARRLAGDVPRRRLRLPPRTARQRETALARRRTAPAGLRPLAAEVGGRGTRDLGIWGFRDLGRIALS